MQRYYLDLHIHSRYSRAVSQQMDLEHLDEWGRKKGIDGVGTGDFTHPEWFKELKEKLIPSGEGVYKLRKDSPVSFFISGEVSCIYSQDGKVRRIHLVILPSSLERAEKINLALSWLGNLRADGRPTFGVDVRKLSDLIWSKDPEALIIPAHIWTPWFSLYGANSGFDSIKEAFGDLEERIYALETGLSSDPEMNWRVEEVRRKVLVSNSDAHSPDKLGRELTVLESEKPLSFPLLAQILKDGYQSALGRIFTVEFYPEEGKYHYDGHRKCGVSLSPRETKKLDGICPKCKRPLTIGVLHRVEELADYEEPRPPKGADFVYAVPLKELIAQVEESTPSSRKTAELYEKVVRQIPEVEFLLEAEEKDLAKAGGERLAQAVLNMRQGKVKRIPGFDGQYGEIKVLIDKQETQASLF
ncbi:DNA helicase UvrD [bacterium]|nr:DNA helicase UvrD [bacterium]